MYNGEDVSSFIEEKIAIREEASRIHNTIMSRLKRVEKISSSLFNNIVIAEPSSNKKTHILK